MVCAWPAFQKGNVRDTLESTFGGGLGVTDPVAGPVVLALK